MVMNFNFNVGDKVSIDYENGCKDSGTIVFLDKDNEIMEIRVDSSHEEKIRISRYDQWKMIKPLENK